MLEGLFRRQDALLKLLYDREKEFSGDIEWLQRRVAGRKICLPVIGAAKLTVEPVGYYPMDEWCAPLLILNLQLSVPSKTLTFRGRIPDWFPQGQTLECTIGEGFPNGTLQPWRFRLERASGHVWRHASFGSGSRVSIYVSGA